MTIENRRAQEKIQMRELILEAAKKIVIEEGFEGVSIRKIAKKIQYSPSLIYHYFENKEEILNQLMEIGYKKIVEALFSTNLKSKAPKDKLMEMTKKYIDIALSMPEEFLSAQLNQSEDSLKHTSSLFKGASKEKPALGLLYKTLEELYREENVIISEEEIELTAQMIAVSTLGLIVKLIIEKDIKKEQKQRLTHHFIHHTISNIAERR